MGSFMMWIKCVIKKVMKRRVLVCFIVCCVDLPFCGESYGCGRGKRKYIVSAHVE